MFFSEITHTTPPPLQKSNSRPFISSLHMIGHISVLHNYCETHYLSSGEGGGGSVVTENPPKKIWKDSEGGPLKLA